MKALRHPSHKAIVIALALTLTACGKSPEQHFQQAQEQLQKADYKAAVIELKSVLQEQPDHREARLLLGEVFIKNGAYPDAEKELTRARSLGAPDEQVVPALAKAYVMMGEPQKALDLGLPVKGLDAQALASLHTMRAEANLALRKREDAEASIQAAKQADPNQPELFLTRAKLALMDNQRDQAEQLIEGALQQDPGYTEALYLKAALLESENKPQDAAKIYQQIVKQDPAQFRAHLAIAGLHMKQGELDAADKAIQAAEKIAQKAPAVMYARGSLELQRGNYDKASTTLQEVLRVAPDHLPSSLAYAMSSYGQENYEQSITHAGKVLRVAPNNLVAGKILAGSQLQTGNVQAALTTLDGFLAKYPNDVRLLAMAGDAHLRAGNNLKAMSYLDQAAELEPDNAAIRTRMAAGHMATGDSKGALADLEAATSLSDKPGQADVALVMLHLKAKEYDKALQSIAALEKKLPNNPVTYNLRAAALIGKQDKAGARKALEQALKIQSDFFPAALNLARLDVEDKKPEAARKRFESILAQDKNNVQAMLALAGLASAEKKEKDYVSWLEKAAKADPKNIQAATGLVQHHLTKKDNQKALALARSVSNADPENIQAISLLGRTQLLAGDHPSAIATFNRLILKAPQSAEAHLRLAQAQMGDKQLAPARASLRKAIQLKPDYFAAQDALLRLELADNQPEAALKIARQIQTQQPKSPQGFDREADILLVQKRFPQAIKAYEQALAKGAGTTGFIKLHRAIFASGDTRTADQKLTDWVKRNPKDLGARGYAAEVYMQTNRSREAITQYEELLKTNPNNAIALNNLANLYQREKDNRALSTAEKAYKLAPDHPGVQDTLGWLLVEHGQLPRALDLLGKASAKLAKVGTVRYHYGVALAQSGKKAEARKELEAAIASEQKFPELEEAKALLKTL